MCILAYKYKELYQCRRVQNSGGGSPGMYVDLMPFTRAALIPDFTNTSNTRYYC